MRASSRPMIAAMAPDRPWPEACIWQAALADEPDGVGEGDDAGGDHGGVLAHRVAGGVGGLRGGDAGRGPALAERGQEGDRDGDEGGLGVDGEVELLGRAVEGEAADRLAEGFVGFGHDGRGGRRGLDQGLAHADRLGSLAGEDERDSIHVLWLVSFGPGVRRVGATARAGTVCHLDRP